MVDGFDELDAMIARVRGVSGLARIAAPDVADILEDDLQRTIGAGQTPEGETWQPRKADGGRPLQNAGAALTVEAIGTSVLVVLRGPEALHHLRRARGGVERRVIYVAGLPSATAAKVRAALGAQFLKAVTP